jgi:hypothetical protein
MIPDSAVHIAKFLAAYSAEQPTTLDTWLDSQLSNYSELWPDSVQRLADAKGLVEHIQRLNANKATLYKHLDAGGSQEGFIEKQLTQSAQSIDGNAAALTSEHLRVYTQAKLDCKVEVDEKDAQSSAASPPSVRWDNEIARIKVARGLKEVIGHTTKLWALLRGKHLATRTTTPELATSGNADLAAYFSADYKDSSHVGVQVAVAAALMVSDRLSRVRGQPK